MLLFHSVGLRSLSLRRLQPLPPKRFREIEQDRNNRVRGVRHFNQGRDRCKRQRPTRERRSPSQERPLRQKKRPTRPKEPLWWRRLELPQRQRTQTEWNNTCTEMGDAQLTRTTSGIISLERNNVRRSRQVIPEGNAPMMRRKLALACITERCCILAANVCTGMEINKCMQTECGAIRKSTVRTKPTTSSTDRITLPRREWTRGAVCTPQ